MVTVIFPAAGVGRRMGAGKNKALLNLCGKPILVRTLLAFPDATRSTISLLPWGRRKWMRFRGCSTKRRG